MSANGISVRLNQENVYNSPGVQSYGVSRIIMHPVRAELTISILSYPNINLFH